MLRQQIHSLGHGVDEYFIQKHPCGISDISSYFYFKLQPRKSVISPVLSANLFRVSGYPNFD